MKKVVFHGTASNDIDRLINDILVNGFNYKKRDNHWLGQGIYFFSEIEWAFQWSNQPRNKDKDTCILEATIFCNDNEFLDLDLPGGHRKITSAIKDINNELKENNILVFKFKNEEQKRCFYLDFIKKKYSYQIIKHTFILENKNSITRDIGIGLSQIQYCVSSNKNIKNVKVNRKNIKYNKDNFAQRRKKLKLR